MKRILLLLGLFCITGFVFAEDKLDAFFKKVEKNILSQEEGVKHTYPINVTLERYAVNLSLYSDLSLEDKGGFLEVIFDAKKIPYIKDYLNKFSSFQPKFFLTSNYKLKYDNKFALGVDLRFKLNKNLRTGSKLYIDLNKNVQGFVYAGFSRSITLQSNVLVYLGLKTSDTNLSNLDLNSLKNDIASIRLDNNSVIGAFVDFDINRRDVAFSLEFNNGHIISTIHLDF